MNLKTLVIPLLIFVNNFLLSAQAINLQKVEMNLIAEFQNFEASYFKQESDSLRFNLKFQIESILSESSSFEYPFDSLSNYVTIIKSNDNNFRVFSWDELTGGSWHDMAVIVQYKTSNQGVNIQWIDSDISEEANGLTDAIQFEVHDIEINKEPHYLCFGWGTYGSGHHHNTILIFSIEDDSLKVCQDCIENNYSVIQAPRSEEINLEYNAMKKVISFNEFIYDHETGFFYPTGRGLNLKLRNGKFEKYGG